MAFGRCRQSQRPVETELELETHEPCESCAFTFNSETQVKPAQTVSGCWWLLVGLLAASLTSSKAQFTETCAAMSLSAEDEVGPYYLDDRLFRSNITEAESGVPVSFFVRVVDTSCSPVADAYVDIWHCNSTGYYSGYLDSESLASGASGEASAVSADGSTAAGPSASGMTAPDFSSTGKSNQVSGPSSTKFAGAGQQAVGPSEMSDPASASTTTASNDNSTFLRGIAPTNSSGIAIFQTIFPGWYSGRATHVHAKIHVPLESLTSEGAEFADSHVVHTGQAFFNDTLTNAIYYNIAPYTDKNASSSDHTLLVNDLVWLSQAKQDVAQVTSYEEVVPGSLADGLNLYITFKVDTTATPAAVATGSSGK
ncbi:hypothetical protein WJX74_001565 [Apatococcus lobatus]|uniref:Intradiol ring-cleavage dioxygenases domain-containing protein n=1 Tax=Apatococcus lobatus TaxID=904363 RepID=A0AAW1QLD8_9CHLO